MHEKYFPFATAITEDCHSAALRKHLTEEMADLTRLKSLLCEARICHERAEIAFARNDASSAAEHSNRSKILLEGVLNGSVAHTDLARVYEVEQILERDSTRAERDLEEFEERESLGLLSDEERSNRVKVEADVHRLNLALDVLDSLLERCPLEVAVRYCELLAAFGQIPSEFRFARDLDARRSQLVIHTHPLLKGCISAIDTSNQRS